MSYIDKLRTSSKETRSIVCMGLDPVVDAMPEEYSKFGISVVNDFFYDIFKEMKTQKVFPGAFKLNEGFYSSFDDGAGAHFIGSDVLSQVIRILRSEFQGIPIILDNKRGDIGKSSKNYANEGFNGWRADAVTVHPYMGSDSVQPFIKFCNENEDKGVYILNKTSNPGSADFQDVEVTVKINGNEMKMPLYMLVSHKIAEWAKGHPGVGAVVGATYPQQLRDIAQLLCSKYQNKPSEEAIQSEIPLLIPGVGSQGGSAKEVVDILRGVGYDLSLARINSSSGLTHPWAKDNKPAPNDWTKVCVAELYKLNQEIAYQPK